MPHSINEFEENDWLGLLSEIFSREHNELSCLATVEYFVRPVEKVRIQTGRFAIAALEAKNHALETSVRLLHALAGPNTFPFLLPLDIGKRVLRQVSRHECPKLQGSMLDPTAALFNDELETSCGVVVHSAV